LKPSVEKRVREARSRAAVRAWEYRQRNHAKGTWYRLRRLLADASVAYALSEDAARQLLAEGHLPEPVGEQMEPPKTILCVPGERIDTLADKRQIPVRLGTDFLTARYVALVRFEEKATYPSSATS
jgi:hypothetical protein